MRQSFLAELKTQHDQLRKMELLTHQTQDNPSPKYSFSEDFYKFPSYYRRAAIAEALGKVSSYGDMENFVEELRAEGYEEVCLIPTANGRFMSKREGRCYFLAGSTLLVGKK